MAISVVSFSFSRCSTGGSAFCWVLAFSTTPCHQRVSKTTGGPEGPFCWVVAFLTTSCLRLLWSLTQSVAPTAPSTGRWLSLPHLASDFSGTQLADFLSSPSYIIVQSPTQSLELHVWSSSSGNNCHAVQWLLSSGASVYGCIMGFYIVPFRQPNPPTRFLSITGYWNVSLNSGASLWNGMFGLVEGEYTTKVPVVQNWVLQIHVQFERKADVSHRRGQISRYWFIWQ